MSHNDNSPVLQCFCGSPCSVYKSKDKTEFLKCGTRLDFKNLAELCKGYKTREAKERFLDNEILGCKLNIKKSDYDLLDDHLWDYPPRFHPRCDKHNLYAKIGVSHTEKNKDRTFFCCAVQYPDRSCDYFHWSDDLIEGMETECKKFEQEQEKHMKELAREARKPEEYEPRPKKARWLK